MGDAGQGLDYRKTDPFLVIDHPRQMFEGPLVADQAQGDHGGIAHVGIRIMQALDQTRDTVPVADAAEDIHHEEPHVVTGCEGQGVEDIEPLIPDTAQDIDGRVAYPGVFFLQQGRHALHRLARSQHEDRVEGGVLDGAIGIPEEALQPVKGLRRLEVRHPRGGLAPLGRVFRE